MGDLEEHVGTWLNQPDSFGGSHDFGSFGSGPSHLWLPASAKRSCELLVETLLEDAVTFLELLLGSCKVSVQKDLVIWVGEKHPETLGMP